MTPSVAHALAGHPYVVCGTVAGPMGSDRPERFTPIRNAERASTIWTFDPHAQYTTWKEMDDQDEEPVVIYYSRTAGEAYPSDLTIRYAIEQRAHYVIVSTRDQRNVEFRSYRIRDGVVTEENVRVVAAYE